MSDTKSAARDALQRLVAEFEATDRSWLAEAESEATARSWVERLLAVFGWNAMDPQQVSQEYTIKGRERRRLDREGISHLRPDYVLRAGTQRLLYIDVKRFDVCIEDDERVSYQVRCYGWSAGFTVSYACDFEELAIYDVRPKPDPMEDPRVARLHYLRHTDYVAQFDLIWEYLSREAITGGSLQRLHPPGERRRGSEPLDVVFEAKLSEWRVELAKSIVRYGKVRDAELISAASQRILDRIVFLRLCEEIGLEEYGELSAMANDPDGFWPLFMEAHEKRYRRVYDGLLFPAEAEDDPSGVETHLRDWWLKGRVFQTIVRGLYSPNPYRFDVVPLELLGGVYERFLGKRLRVVGSTVTDEFKPEYQRTKGAVYTPPWIVRRVVDRTLGPLTSSAEPEAILALRVLDPACGSGSFLLGVYDHLEEALLDWARRHPRHGERAAVVVDDGAGLRLGCDTVRRLINGCLYGVDIDPNAVEVARMSLALRFLERVAGDESAEPQLLLAGIGRNIRQGNSLVGPEIAGLGFDPARVAATMPFAWKDRVFGFGDVLAAGGFDAVVGNPPYIEVKRYKEWMPEMYRYLKEGNGYVTTEQGKTDIAMPFMELSVRQLRPRGRLGFIIQNRFFKTEYGESTRRWLRTEKLLEAVDDFRDLQVFPGRTTYTSILVLQAGTESLRYRTFEDAAAAEADVPSLDVAVPVDQLDDGPWSLDSPDLLAVHRALARRHGTIGEHPGLEISVGLQTLWGKLYQLAPLEVGPRVVRGVNGLGAEVSLERKALRPLCRNRGFYPFRTDNADAWVVFPYDVTPDGFSEIRWPEFEQRFPKTASYLKNGRNELRKAVEVPEGRDRWHLYTRPQNLVAQARPKVLFPSTIEDTVAAVDAEGDIYQDNVRLCSLSVARVGLDPQAVAAVMNSTVFNALARAKAGLSDGGWRQFNRQFAALVPFPLRALTSGPHSARLVSVAGRITAQQQQLRVAQGEGQTRAVKGMLSALWSELDVAVEEAYGLTARERAVIARYPRRIDRVEWPLRSLDRETAEGEAVEDS